MSEKVRIYGYVCQVVSRGKCEDDGCDKPTVTVIDHDGQEDTLHTEDTEPE